MIISSVTFTKLSLKISSYYANYLVAIYFFFLLNLFNLGLQQSYCS